MIGEREAMDVMSTGLMFVVVDGTRTCNFTFRAMPVSVPRLESLADAIPPIFMQCQTSVASHRKNVVALAKIHGQTSDVWEEVPQRGIKLTGEKAFNDRFIDMVDRVLHIKKGIPNADRIIKFIGAFILHISQKGKQRLRAS